MFSNHEGSVSTSDSDSDPYFKIKLHACLALQNIAQHNGRLLFNYWYILFPTFMMRHQPEFAMYLKEMKQYQVQKDFSSEVFPLIEKNEPTLLYVIRHKTT